MTNLNRPDCRFNRCPTLRMGNRGSAVAFVQNLLRQRRYVLLSLIHISTQGQPEMWVENIPPTSEIPELEITRPEIYYGQLTNDYVIVNTKEPEFDYPIGDTNAQSQYEGCLLYTSSDHQSSRLHSCCFLKTYDELGYYKINFLLPAPYPAQWLFL